MATKHTKFIGYEVGPADNLRLEERELQIEEGDVLMKVKAVGMNRAETLHRQGKYKITKPKEAFIGLEACGEIYDPKTK